MVNLPVKIDWIVPHEGCGELVPSINALSLIGPKYDTGKVTTKYVVFLGAQSNDSRSPLSVGITSVGRKGGLGEKAEGGPISGGGFQKTAWHPCRARPVCCQHPNQPIRTGSS